jgi:hypothetical protein
MVGGALVLGGALGAFLLLTVGAFGFLGRIDHLARIEVPGARSVHLDRGTVTVFDEPSSGSAVAPATIQVTVTPVGGGRSLTVGPPRHAERYLIEGRNGVAIAAIDVPSAGSYRVEVQGPPASRVAIGPSPRRHLTDFGVAALVVVVLGVGGGIVVLVFTRRRRRDSMSKWLPIAPGSAG